MSRIISALLLAVFASVAIAAEPVKLANNAPETYVVVKGDTLWGISGKFLQEPWRWPEIWRLNKDQIKNPHRIYPGDIVVLDLSEGSPRLRLGKQVGDGSGRLSPKVYEEAIPREIPSIPVHIIEPFISRPLVVNANEMKDAPRVIGAKESRVITGAGDEIYVLGLNSDHGRWYVYRPGTPMRDPESGRVIGYEARYLGTAKVTQPGETTIMEIISAKEEILKGDLLGPAEVPDLAPYAPHEPEDEIRGNVLSIYGGVGSGGKDSVISLNVGALQGVERGHVLAIYSKRSTTFTTKDGVSRTQELPEERYGLVFVFRVFDQVSYGLVMESKNPLKIGDAVRNP